MRGMPLIVCPNCSKEISSEGLACPNCWKPERGHRISGGLDRLIEVLLYIATTKIGASRWSRRSSDDSSDSRARPVALTICPDCSEEISMDAFVCPNCGRPTSRYHGSAFKIVRAIKNLLYIAVIGAGVWIMLATSVPKIGWAFVIVGVFALINQLRL